MAVLLGLGAVLAVMSTSHAQSTDPLQPSFSWTMEPRFGADADGDGRIEIENTPEYAHNSTVPCGERCANPRFSVRLAAAPTPADLGVPESFISYEWDIAGPSGRGIYRSLRPETTVRLAEGRYTAVLEVRLWLPWGTATATTGGAIEVDDLVVVALGDSYASGEGSPEEPAGPDGEPAVWADASDTDREAEHARAHRSTVGWPVRVALGLEDASAATSVTFVNLTSSGARIDRGVLGSRDDLDLPAQVDQLEDIVQSRPVDLVLLQVGGNDVGFSHLIRALVDADPQLDPLCYDVMIDNAWAAVEDGIWDRGARVRYRPPFSFSCEPTEGSAPSLVGLSGLGAAFGRLDAAFARIGARRVVLVEYPDPTGSPAPGERCREIVGDVTPPFGFHEVDEAEQEAGVDRLLRPLNETLAEIAADRGWTLVDGVAAAFGDGHGYCAPWPDYGYPDWFDRSPLLFGNRLDVIEGWYRVPGRYGSALLLNDGTVSWYRTAAQSGELQGPLPRYLTAGTLHPNEQGHLAIARMVLSALSAAD
jgi:lysophospholipase L1-like esterase